LIVDDLRLSQKFDFVPGSQSDRVQLVLQLQAKRRIIDVGATNEVLVCELLTMRSQELLHMDSNCFIQLIGAETGESECRLRARKPWFRVSLLVRFKEASYFSGGFWVYGLLFFCIGIDLRTL